MNNIAFVVGCEEYDNFDNLVGVNDDVASMQSALIYHCGCLIENVYIITNQSDSDCEPTGIKILNLIVQKSKNYSSESIENLFFYFSGHGYLSAQNKVCLILKDSMISPITVGTVEVETIISALKQFDNVKHIILFLDICQNEIMTKGVIGEQIITSDYFPQGVVIFFSCFPKNPSYMIPNDYQEKYGKGSIFTKCLVDSLQPQNKCHSVKEISAFLKKSVINLSSQLGFEQKPYTQTEDISLDDVIISFGNEDTNKVNTYMTNDACDEYLYDCIFNSILIQNNLLDVFNSFSVFLGNESVTYLSQISSDISNYTRTVDRSKKFIQVVRILSVLVSKQMLKLKKLTIEFREKWITHYANISIAIKKLEEYNDTAICNMRNYDNFISKIESVFNEVSIEKAGELQEKINTMREYISSCRNLYLYINNYRNAFMEILLKMEDWSHLFSSVENTNILPKQNDPASFLSNIEHIVYSISPLFLIISQCQTSIAYDKMSVINTMVEFKSGKYNSISW